MFRYNLDINYGCIEEMAIQSEKLHKALNSLNIAVNRISGIVDANKGLTAEELKNKCPEITDKIAKIDVGAQKSAYLLREFKDVMTGIIPPKSEGVNLRVNVNDTKNKCNSMTYDIQEMVNYVSGLGTDIRDTFFILDQTENAEEIQSANQQLNRIKEQLMEIANNISSKYLDDIEKYRKKVEEYSQADNDFEGEAQTLYYDYADIGFWQTNTGKLIIGAGLLVGCVLLIATAPAWAPVAAGVLGVSAAVVEATCVGIGTWGLACGGMELAYGTIDSVANKTDLDSAMLKSWQKGAVVGMITRGLGPVINAGTTKAVETIATNVPRFGQQITNIAPKVIPFISDVSVETIGNVANDMLNEEDIHLDNTVAKAVGGRIIKVGKNKTSDKLFQEVEEIGERNIVKKVVEKGGKASLDYAEDYAKDAYNKAVDDIHKGTNIDVSNVLEDKKDMNSSHVERFLPNGIDPTQALHDQIERIAKI